MNPKEKLLRMYPYRIELHTHTAPVSACSEVSPEEVVETYAKLGYDAVTITNHFMRTEEAKEAYIDAYLSAFEQAQIAAKRWGIQVLFGAEIRFVENCNDYLIYGVDGAMLTDIYDLLPYGVEQFRNKYPMKNSLFVHAHPFRDGMTAVSPQLLDGVEVFNMHPNHNSRVGLAAKFAAENPQLIVTAGSDFHHAHCNHEGVSAIRCAQLPTDSFELATLLKTRDYVFEIGMQHIVL